MIPKSVTTLGGAAFYGRSSLASINVPNSVTSIGTYAFSGCSSLTKIEIPNSVTSIGNFVFSPNLTVYCEQGSCADTVAKNENVSVVYTTINESDLINKDDLSNKVDKLDGDNGITIGSDVGHILGLHIKSSEIYEDSEERFKLSKDGLVINYNASGYAPNTADVIVNRNVESAEGTYNVVSHKLTEKADEVELERLKYYDDKDIIPSDSSYFTVNSTGETITGLTDTGKTQTELVIPYEINGKKITKLEGSVTGGVPQSILGGSSVTKVVIPESVTILGNLAFYDSSSLTSVNIPNSVTSIGDNTFAICTSLTSINIPNSVTSIYNEAFSGCSSLKSIDIPNSVTSIRYNAFYDCTSLASINIPNSVTSIDGYAFANCTSLTSINIPNSVTSIGDAAFSGCSSNFTIYSEQGSYAETYAKANSISIVYTDMKDTALDNKVDKVEGKSLIDENVANNLSSDTTTVRIKKGTELKTNGSEINGVRIDDNSVTVEDVKNDMSDPYIGYKNVMDKDGLHIYGVDPGGNQDTNERVDITSSGVKYSGAQGNGRTLKLGFEGAGFPQLTMDGNPGESKSVKIDFDDVIVQNESTTHKLSEKANRSDVLLKDSSGDFLYGGTTISDTEVATMGHALTEKAKAKTYTVSVPTTSWTEKTDTDNQKYYYKKITVSGMKASGQAMTDVAMSDSVATARKEMEAYQCVNRVVTGKDYVELYCFDEVPTTAFTLRILVISNILS